MDTLVFDISLLFIFLAGAFGALVSDILNDNCLEIPKNLDGKFFLGAAGGIIIGGVAGLLIDGSFLTAFMAGFTGKAIILRLIK